MISTESTTLYRRFDAVANAEPDSVALVQGDIEVTYGELASSVNTVTAALRSLNLPEGDRVAVVGKKSIDTVTVLLAALRLPIVIVIINPVLKAPQIAHILADSGADTLFCDTHLIKNLFRDNANPVCVKHVVETSSPTTTLLPGAATDQYVGRSNASEFGQDVKFTRWRDFIGIKSLLTAKDASLPTGDEAAIILYTSGSTGKPKGVILSHANLFYGAASVCTYLQNTGQDRILALMPFSFDYGLSQLTTAIYSGATLILHDYLVPRGVINTAIENKVTGIPAVPHLWEQLIKIDWPVLSHLRYITSTGGRLQVPTIRALAEKLPGTAIYSMYGFTEAFRATYLPPADVGSRPDSIGKAVPYSTVLIVDTEGRELPPGEPGELIQCGPLVSLGYWNNEAASALKIRKRDTQDSSQELYAWSGDFAYKDKDGYIYYIARKDDQVKLNGHRASPNEIETALSECPWIAEASVICVPDDRFGFVAIAFVVLEIPVEPKELSRWCKKVLPSYMVPAQWFVLNQLPVTPNNKIDREALRAHL